MRAPRTRASFALPLVVVTACFLGALLPGSVHAQASERELDGRAHRISSQLMSPFCPGRTLTECPSPSAAEWRMDVRTMVEEGKTAAEIRQTLEARMPNAEITGDPGTHEGMHPLWWVLIAAIVLPALVIFPRTVRRRRSKTRSGAARDGAARGGAARGGAATDRAARDRAATDQDSDIEARLEDELAALDV